MIFFAIESVGTVDLSWEEELVIKWCTQHPDQGTCVYNGDLPISIPVGSVEFCARTYGRRVPDPYPDFLKEYTNRRIWKSDISTAKTYVADQKPIFVKPSDEIKSWTGKVVNDVDQLSHLANAQKVWCSDVVVFENEWRYYVASGRVVASGWYDGMESDDWILEHVRRRGCYPPAPALPTKLTDLLLEQQWSGLLDMGFIDEHLELVEAAEPYAFAWYPETDSMVDAYIDFLVAGDRFMRSRVSGEQ